MAAQREDGTEGQAPRRAFPPSPRGLAAMMQEMRRRHALATRPQPAGIATPKPHLLLGEFASLAMPAGRPASLPKAEAPRVIMLVPGFGSHPWRMAPLRRALAGAGHRVSDWGMGWNLGAGGDRFAQFTDRVARMAEAEDRPLTLVGWSMGGIFAREAAKALPDRVELVVTMGTPFSGDMHGNNAWRAYHWIAGHAVDEPPVEGDIAAKPPVPTVALWSARDGIVERHCACGRPGERDLALAVRCTHMGFAWHPAAIEAVARVLALPAGAIRPDDEPSREGADSTV